jgi:O-antigen/teichoic acid export membrane protein
VTPPARTAGRDHLRATAGTLALRVASLGLLFACHLLLTRTLGARGYGLYAYAVAWLNVLIVPATLGADRLVVRQVAVYRATGDWSSWRGFLEWSGRSVVLASLGLALLGAAASWAVAGRDGTPGAFRTAMLLLPALALARLAQYALQGMQRPVLGQLAEGIVHPVALIALVAAWRLGGRELSATGAMALNAAATCAALACAVALFRRSLPRPVREAAPTRRVDAWSRSVLPLVAVSGLYAVSGQVPVLVLGALGGAEEAGVLAVAKRLADLVVLPTLAASATLAPTLAGQWATRDTSGFQRTLTTFTRGVAGVAVPLAIVLVLLRRPLLEAFGAPFGAGAGALALLCAGQVVSVMVGSVNLALVVADQERVAALAAAAHVALNAGLCALLVPRWGVEGAAAAATVSLVAWNLLLAARVRRLLGIRPTVLAGPAGSHAAA